MERPKCKLCGGRHWLREPHDVTIVKPLPPDTGVTVVKPPTNVTHRGFGSGAGRPRLHGSNATRQRAYRGRHV